MKKLLATLVALFVVCLPLCAHADTVDDWLLFSGSADIAAELDDSLFNDSPDSVLNLQLKNSNPSVPVDTSLSLPDDAASHILSDPQLSTVIDSITKQTLTQAGSLKGRFVIVTINFGKLRSAIEDKLYYNQYLIAQENAAYAALGLNTPNTGVIDGEGLAALPDILAIPIQEGTRPRLAVYAGDDLSQGAASASDTLTIEIDATELSYAPLPTHVSGFDRVSVSPNGAARISPVLSYTERTAFGTKDMNVPGNISWGFFDSFNNVSDTAPNGSGLANLAAYLLASYPPNTAVGLQWTASPADTSFSCASGSVSAQVVQGAPQISNAMSASFGTPSINTSHNTYNGFGDFLIQTGSMRQQLSGLSINGVTLLEGVDYTIEETAGNTATIRVYESVMQAITVGDAQITVRFVNGSVNTTVMIAGFYVPEILTDPPKTGDAKAIDGVYVLLCALALALACAHARRRSI